MGSSVKWYKPKRFQRAKATHHSKFVGMADGPTVKAETPRQPKALGRVAKLRRRTAPVLAVQDTLSVIEEALRKGGYGGDIRPALLLYLAATTRLLAMRQGAMPAHALLLGQPGAGKNYALQSVLRLLPHSAYHIIEAGSPRALIYSNADLRHRVLVFGEADSLPSGEDNPAASAVRNLLQDHRLHYEVTVRNPREGAFEVQHIDKPGPTVLITTATRRLGPQLDSRLFAIEVPDDQRQVRAALQTQARLELEGAQEPPASLVAYQEYLQESAPWDVSVPFIETLAHALGRTPAAPRVHRDFARLVALVKASAILRQHGRRKDGRGRVVAEMQDYATVHGLLQDVYAASVTGVSQKVRDVVVAVNELRKDGSILVTTTAVAKHLGIAKATASRHVRVALRGGWLVSKSELQRGRPLDLELGDPLPDHPLPPPEALEGFSVSH